MILAMTHTDNPSSQLVPLVFSRFITLAIAQPAINPRPYHDCFHPIHLSYIAARRFHMRQILRCILMVLA
jgi:hypothetical protein